MSTSTETLSRPPRAPAASVLLTVAAIVVALVLAPVSAAAAAEPLPTGTYTVEVGTGEVVVTVAEDRSVGLTASDGLLVELAFDEDRRVLDEFTVRAEQETFLVEVDAAEDGSYTAVVEPVDEQDDEQDGTVATGGEVVQLVAACAPTGIVAAAVGLPNHGTIVSAAASGLDLTAKVTDPVSGDATDVVADFSSVAGAEAFCALIDATVPSIEEVRAELAAQREEVRSDRAAARAERETVQEASRHARAAEREAVARLRELEREARAAERAADVQDRQEDRGARAGERDAPTTGRQDEAATLTDGLVDDDDSTGEGLDPSSGGDSTSGTDTTDTTDTTGSTDTAGDETPTEEVTEPTPGKSKGNANGNGEANGGSGGSGGNGGGSSGQGQGPTK